MSHDVLTPPEEQLGAAPLPRRDHTDLLPVGAEGSVLKSLFENIRDLVRPQKLPPLELTSTPVAVVDPLAVKRDAKSSAISFGIHVLIIALIIALFLFAKKQPQIKKAEVTPIDISAYLPRTPKITAPSGGGGGGGNHEITPPTKGKLPQFAKTQITPPQVLKVDHPKLPVPATVVMPQMKMPDTNMPNLGIPQASKVTMAQGSGGGSGFGQGKGGGLGIGSGNGIGPGNGGDTGGGFAHPGGGISSPKIIYAVDPEFSDEARRQKYQGVVVLSLVVDAQGNPQRIRVHPPAGHGSGRKGGRGGQAVQVQARAAGRQADSGRNQHRSQLPALLTLHRCWCIQKRPSGAAFWFPARPGKRFQGSGPRWGMHGILGAYT